MTPTTPSGCLITSLVAGSRCNGVATRRAFIHRRTCRRVCRIAESTTKISARSVSCRERWPKSAETASMIASSCVAASWRSRSRRLRRTSSDGFISRVKAPRCAAKAASRAAVSAAPFAVARAGASATRESVIGSVSGAIAEMLPARHCPQLHQRRPPPPTRAPPPNERPRIPAVRACRSRAELAAPALATALDMPIPGPSLQRCHSRSPVRRSAPRTGRK